MKYYAVRRGRRPGIYESWTACWEQIHGYSGATFKSFENEADAQKYLEPAGDSAPINKELPFAYIDGSYSKKGGCYSWGGFICAAGHHYIIQGSGSNPEYLKYRNIAGETIGALQILFTAQRLQIRELNLYFDYAGIENWISGEWKANTKLTQHYQQTTELMQDCVSVHYEKLAGHTGIEGNEIADYLAKEAAGVKLPKKGRELLQAFRDQVLSEQ